SHLWQKTPSTVYLKAEGEGSPQWLAGRQNQSPAVSPGKTDLLDLYRLNSLFGVPTKETQYHPSLRRSARATPGTLDGVEDLRPCLRVDEHALGDHPYMLQMPDRLDFPQTNNQGGQHL